MLFELISGHTVAGNNELIKNTGGGAVVVAAVVCVVHSPSGWALLSS